MIKTTEGNWNTNWIYDTKELFQMLLHVIFKEFLSLRHYMSKRYLAMK